MALDIMFGPHETFLCKPEDQLRETVASPPPATFMLAPKGREVQETFHLKSFGIEYQDIPCFASELEEEVAQLEEAARRENEDLDYCVTEDTYGSSGTCHFKACSDELESPEQYDCCSEEDSEMPTRVSVAAIKANAGLVVELGGTLAVGAWRGCSKSPWCDREDRHRGLCNHKATIPGPAACADPAGEVEPGLTAADADEESMDGNGSCEQDSAGHSSHNLKTMDSMEDDKEVASVLKSGCLRLTTPEASAEEEQSKLQPLDLDSESEHRVGSFWAEAVSEGAVQFDVQPSYQLAADISATSEFLEMSGGDDLVCGSAPGSPIRKLGSTASEIPNMIKPLASSTAPFSRSLSLPSSPTATSGVVPVLALSGGLGTAQAAKPVVGSAPAGCGLSLAVPKMRAVKNKASKRDLDGGSSPRGKKRTAGRIAANPNGHCCTQCGTQSTPVWRAGPHGPKTLCNACGVRYMKVAKKK